MKKLVFIILVGLLVTPYAAAAKIGVGVGTGKIQVDQALKAGVIYTLPPFSVINTGDEPARYQILVQHRENQAELVPAPEWFTMTPQTFDLDPGKVQVVAVKLNLPVQGVRPGDYFGLLTAKPDQPAAAAGGTSIGVAAASKLYFTVAPANIFEGIFYRIGSLVRLWTPWSYIVPGIVILAILIIILKKFVNFDISVKKKKKKR